MYYTVNNPIEQRRPDSRGAFCLAVLLIGVAFFCTEHRLLASAMEAYGTTSEELETVAEGGQLKNYIGFSLVALVGCGLVIRRSARRFSGIGLLGLLILAFLGLCLASALWSFSPWTTTKRLVILLFCVLGAVGVAKQFSARDLCLLTLIVTTAYVAIGLGAELALGTFHPLSPEYRFAGTMHPSGQGDHCACMCLAAILLCSSVKRGRYLLIALAMMGGGLLILTGARTPCISLLVALLAVFSLRLSIRTQVGLGFAVAWSICAIVLAAHLFGGDEKGMTLLALGRPDHVGTLTGRTELWEELLWYIEKRPALGYGYCAFWTPDHIQEISSTLFWGVSSAHSIYLKTVLDVGLVGIALFLVTALVATLRAATLARATGDVGYGFVFSMLVFGTVNGVTEAGFAAVSFLTWVAACGLLQLAFFRDRSNVSHGTL
jgi:exopolysaccharide production protein ExoQ